MNQENIDETFKLFLSIIDKNKYNIITETDYVFCQNIINKLLIEKDNIIISKLQQTLINKEWKEMDKSIHNMMTDKPLFEKIIVENDTTIYYEYKNIIYNTLRNGNIENKL